MTDPSIVAQGYDAVYGAMPRSPTLLGLWKQLVAGHDYPDDFYHISFITLRDLRHLARALGGGRTGQAGQTGRTGQAGQTGRTGQAGQTGRTGRTEQAGQAGRTGETGGPGLSRGSTFADVACGMGGPALWIARETGARLSGVDLSPVAVARAETRAKDLGLAAAARFTTGSFADTGLETASMDAAMTVDALQYAPDKSAALREFARIIRPGGTLAFFAFELHPERAEGLPVIGDDPVDDYRPLLRAACFDVLQYDETPDWHDRLFTAYRAVIDAQEALRQEMGEPATAAMLSEMTLTLERDIYSGRVFAVAKRTDS